MTNNREEQIYKAADKATYQTPPQYSELVHKSRKVMCAYETGFIDGCVWADSHPHWIPVEEKLPGPHFADTSSDWVLICTTKGGIFIDSYNHKHNEWCNNRTSVTHWMPMPQAPRKEE